MAARLLYQVGASVTATLVASAIFASLPKSSHPAAPPSVELTSGGKFAARIAGVAEAGIGAAEIRVPLPVLTMVSTQPFDVDPAADVRPADLARAPDLVARPVRPKAHAAARADRGRTPDAASILPPPRNAVVALTESPSIGEDGFLPRLGSSARSLWSMTASAGGSLLSHLMP